MTKDDSRKPQEHACYACLFESDPTLLGKMQRLVTIRNIIAILAKHGYTSIKAVQERTRKLFTFEFSSYVYRLISILALDIKDNKLVGAIVKTLKEQEILVKSSSISQKPSSAWQIASAGKGRITMLKEYFDPTLYIGHLVCRHLEHAPML